MRTALIALAFASLLALPARAEIPDFCANPTDAQKANQALMDECRQLKEAQAATRSLREVVSALGETLEAAKRAMPILDPPLPRPKP